MSHRMPAVERTDKILEIISLTARGRRWQQFHCEALSVDNFPVA